MNVPFLDVNYFHSKLFSKNRNWLEREVGQMFMINGVVFEEF